MLTVTIRTENAAFEGRPGDECARLLSLIAPRLVHGETRGRLLDFNGNHVGEWALTEGDEVPAPRARPRAVCIKCKQAVKIKPGWTSHAGHVRRELDENCGRWGYRLLESGAGAGGGQP